MEEENQDDLFHTSSEERNVQLLTHLIGFLSTIQTITRDLKLVGGKMGPNNKKLVQAFDKLQNSHSNYQDIIQSFRNLRSEVAGIKDQPMDITLVGGGKAARRKMQQMRQEEQSDEKALQGDTQQLQARITSLNDKLKRTTAELEKKKEYVSWLTMKNQQLAARIPGGAGTPDPSKMLIQGSSKEEVQDIFQHVTEDYKRLLSNEYKAALAEVENMSGVTRNNAYQFLCEVFMVSQAVATKEHNAVFEKLNEAIQPITTKPFPDTAAQIQEKLELEIQQKGKKKKEEPPPPLDPMSIRTKAAFSETLRNAATKIDVAYLIEQTKLELATNPKEHTTCKALKTLVKQSSYGEATEAFIAATARLCWRMITQTPVLVFRKYRLEKEKEVDLVVHIVSSDSKDPTKYPSLFYVYPCFVHVREPNKLMVQGCLYCG